MTGAASCSPYNRGVGKRSEWFWAWIVAEAGGLAWFILKLSGVLQWAAIAVGVLLIGATILFAQVELGRSKGRPPGLE